MQTLCQKHKQTAAYLIIALVADEQYPKLVIYPWKFYFNQVPIVIFGSSVGFEKFLPLSVVILNHTKERSCTMSFLPEVGFIIIILFWKTFVSFLHWMQICLFPVRKNSCCFKMGLPAWSQKSLKPRIQQMTAKIIHLFGDDNGSRVVAIHHVSEPQTVDACRI